MAAQAAGLIEIETADVLPSGRNCRELDQMAQGWSTAYAFRTYQ
jgi:hypothetical protein